MVNVLSPVGTSGSPTPPPPATQYFSQNTQDAFNAVMTAAGTVSAKKSVKKQKVYNLPLLEAFPGRLEKCEGEVGLEIECEGTNLFAAPIKFWRCAPDGSLRSHGDHPPVEYVLRKPLSREAIPHALTYLSNKLREAGSEIDESTRTSVHVHVNCQSLTVKQIYQYWCLYTVFEEMLVDFSGPDRVGNLFCLRSKDAEVQVDTMEQAIKNESFNDLFSDSTRYTSCNMASLGKFGSMEFRSMRGTVDQDLIQSWVDILLRLKDKALEYDNPRDIVTDFSELGPEGFLDKIFSGCGIYNVFRSRPDLNTTMWDGLRLMRDVAYSVKWEKYDPSIKVSKAGQGDRLYSPDGTYYMSPAGTGGIYYLVNISHESIHVPNLLNPNTGMWNCGVDRKLGFNSSHGYLGGFPLTQSDLAPPVTAQEPSPYWTPDWIEGDYEVLLINSGIYGVNLSDGQFWVCNTTNGAKMTTFRGRGCSLLPNRAYKFRDDGTYVSGSQRNI